MRKTATRTTWKNYPIDKPERIEIALRFTGRQFSRLKKGFIPKQMEEKWFIFYENNWLYFHRSWTGFGIFSAQLINEQGSYVIKEFWAERNKEKYKNESAKVDIETISFLIAGELLRLNAGNIFDDQHFQTDKDVIRGWSKFGNLLFTNPDVDYTDEIKSVLFGVAVGDALGVPVEFETTQPVGVREWHDTA